MGSMPQLCRGSKGIYRGKKYTSSTIGLASADCMKSGQDDGKPFVGGYIRAKERGGGLPR